MSERGTATKINGSEVTVRIDLEANCAGCMNHEACGISGSVINALDPEGLVQTPGERVEIVVPARAQAAGAFWLIVLPLVLFGAGYLAGSRLFPNSGEGPAALLGIGGLALGLGAAALLQRGKRPSSLPRVVRILKAEDEASASNPGCLTYSPGAQDSV